MMRKGVLCVVLLILLSLMPLVAAAEADCVYFFYGIDCLDCAAADQFIGQLELQHPELKVDRFEVYKEQQNAKLLEQYFTAHAIPKHSRGVPAVFVGKSYLIGSSSINSLLPGMLEENQGSTCPSLQSAAVVGVVGESEPYDVFKTLTFFGVTGSAIADSFSLGSLAVLLLLLALIVAIKDEVQMVKRAAFFIVASFFAYLLVGVGLFRWIQHPLVYVSFYKVGGIVALLVGIVRIKGFFGTWKFLLDNVDEKLRLQLRKIKAYFTSLWGLVIVGFLAAILTSGRLSKVFAILQSLLTQSDVRVAAIPLLLYYCVLLVLPMAIVIVILHRVREMQQEQAEEKGNSDMKRAAWKKHYHKVFSVSVSVIMVVLGLVLIFV